MNELQYGVITTLIAIMLFAYLTIRQSKIALANRDNVSPLRYIMLAILLMITLNSIPVLIWQSQRLYGIEDENWHKAAIYSSGFNRIAIPALMITFVRYRIKEDEE